MARCDVLIDIEANDYLPRQTRAADADNPTCDVIARRLTIFFEKEYERLTVDCHLRLGPKDYWSG